MIIRQSLSRQGRALWPSTRPSIKQRIQRAAASQAQAQARHLHADGLHLNLSDADREKSIEQLLNEGLLNANVAQWLQRRQLNATIGHFGADAEPGYQPHTLLTQPPAAQDVTLELLLASQTHLGHATSLWHPGNARFIFGIREGVHIISLEATAAHLRRAARVVRSVADQAGLILFVGTRRGHERAVVNAAQRANACHIFDRWVPGTLTNGERILLNSSKRVVDHMDRTLLGFEDQLAATASLKPDLVVCLNTLENYVLLHECALHNVPTIGVIDTNCNPTWVTYPIPANDDSLRSINVIAGVLGKAAEEGRNARLQRAEDEDEVLPTKTHKLVLPEEYDPDAGSRDDLAADQDGEGPKEVIDLRDLTRGGSVTFAEPQFVRRASSRRGKEAGDVLKEMSRGP